MQRHKLQSHRAIVSWTTCNQCYIWLCPATLQSPRVLFLSSWQMALFLAITLTNDGWGVPSSGHSFTFYRTRGNFPLALWRWNFIIWDLGTAWNCTGYRDKLKDWTLEPLDNMTRHHVSRIPACSFMTDKVDLHFWKIWSIFLTW